MQDVRRLLDDFRTRERQGIREPVENAQLQLSAAVVIADQGVVRDLERLIPTFMHWVPDVPLYLVGDEFAITRAVAITHELGCGERLFCREWINDDSLQEANDRLSNLVNQSNYWKPGPIWWKLEGLRRIYEEVQDGVLLLDSDIIFTAPFVETKFHGVDLVLSPFYWIDPEYPVPEFPGSLTKIPIACRDGAINAGFVMVGRSDVVELWQQLYEEGVGKFYEQWIMRFLPMKYRSAFFSYLHNWGSWRRESPPEDVRSLHFHKWVNPQMEWHMECQERANQAVEFAREQLLSKK